MKGGIYSDEKCPICGSRFKDTGKNLACPNHPEIETTALKVKFGDLCHRTDSYVEASRTLTGWRFKTDEGTFDQRDYKKDNPLGFSNLMEDYWNDKTVESTNRYGETERKIKDGTEKNYTGYKNYFCSYFKNDNIKVIAIDEGRIADSINRITWVGNKTKDNYRSFLNDFFAWVWSRNKTSFAKEAIPQPELPKIKFTLKPRKRVSKEVQFEILEEVKRLTYHINPKIYLGIKWVCTYIKVRPGEMLSLQECDINLMTRHFIFPNPKEDKWKQVPLINEDVEILKFMGVSNKQIPFFRHVKGIKGVAENEPFGEKYLYKWWIRACTNLGVEGVDLYGGSKHSSTTGLRHKYSPEQIQQFGTGHLSDAFLRYFDTDDEQSRELYQETLPKRSNNVIEFDPALTLKNGTKKEG